jgi:hypothetical protein
MAAKLSATKPKASPAKPLQFISGSRVSVVGGSVPVGKLAKSPLSAIVAQIKRDPALGAKLAKEAGIITSKGKLTKSYG